MKALFALGHCRFLPQRLCKDTIGEMQKPYLNRSLLCVTRPQTVRNRSWIFIYLCFTSWLQALQHPTWVWGGEGSDGGGGGVWCCWGKRLTSKLFFESKRERMGDTRRGERGSSLCISKSQLIFPVREQWDMDPPPHTHTHTPGSAECNSTTCSESPSLLIRGVDLSLPCTRRCDAPTKTLRESFRRPFFNSWITPLRMFLYILRAAAKFSLKFKREICLPYDTTIQWKTWQPFKVPGSDLV